MQIADHDFEKAAVYEVAVHAMHHIFLDPETGVLLVDAANNQQATFYNITIT